MGDDDRRVRAYHATGRTEEDGESFFSSLCLASNEVLRAAKRARCPGGCGSTRRYYCGTCRVWVGALALALHDDEHKIQTATLADTTATSVVTSSKDTTTTTTTTTHAASSSVTATATATATAVPTSRSSLPPPRVALPLEIVLVKHRHEPDTKSTAVHVALLAPECARIVDFPFVADDESITTAYSPSSSTSPPPQCGTTTTFAAPAAPAAATTTAAAAAAGMTTATTTAAAPQPFLFNPATTVLVFPDEDAPSSDIPGGCDLRHVRTAVFLDARWHQTRAMMQDPQLAALPRIRLGGSGSKSGSESGLVTYFWRTQRGRRNSDLATVEAVYHFVRQVTAAQELLLSSLAAAASTTATTTTATPPPAKASKHCSDDNAVYDGRYDNLLWLFAHQYRTVQAAYRENPARRARSNSKLNQLGYIDYYGSDSGNSGGGGGGDNNSSCGGSDGGVFVK